MYLYVLLEVTGEDRAVMDVDVVVVGNGQVVTEDQMCNALERLYSASCGRRSTKTLRGSCTKREHSHHAYLRRVMPAPNSVPC